MTDHESRLLTKEERTAINDAMPSEAKYGDVFEAIAKAQRDLTASIKDAECQARVEGIKRGIENLSPTLSVGDDFAADLKRNILGILRLHRGERNYWIDPQEVER